MTLHLIFKTLGFVLMVMSIVWALKSANKRYPRIVFFISVGLMVLGILLE
jgi:predicted membrane channel-forming protein YqfA (hemolysin III family)